MEILQNKHIKLRALEPEDLDFIFEIENDTSFWEISNTITPYSKKILKSYLENAHLDLFEIKQLRLVITENVNNDTVGLIDLFDFDPQHNRAGIGILILKEFQKKKYAQQALKIMIDYVFNILNLHQIYANIPTDNTKSIGLFEKLDFELTGTKKSWMHSNGVYKDVAFYQLINRN